MSVEAVARKWYDQLLRTDPVDHEAAEAAVRDAYRLAGIAEPERFLWCASPLEAVCAVLVLVGKTEGYNQAVYEDVERSKSGKGKLVEARVSVAERLGIAEGEVEGYFGRPFYVAEGSNPVTKKLMENFDAWMARAEAGDDFLAAHKSGPFKPLHDLEQDLHYEGYKGLASKGSLFKEALAAAGGKHLAILVGRSAQHRLYGNFAYSEVAQDEALAQIGKLEPTDLQRAVWAAYEASGMWWPCHNGVVFAERPIAVEQDGDRIGMRWADGFTVGEISGRQPTAETPSAPASVIANKASGDAPILGRALSSDHEQRVAELLSTGPLPLFDRYLAGEHEQVWKELNALGEGVRSDPHAADAMAVAYETMHRVLQNVRLISDRLKGMKYNFVQPGSGGGLFGFRKAKAHAPHVPSLGGVNDRIAELEAIAGGPIPLSLRAFFEVVGEVDLNGDHPVLAPKDGQFTSDPLMVCGVEDAIAMVESDDRDEDDPLLFEFAPDALHKANISGGSPYSIALPQAAADALVEDEPHGVTFVEYLRIAIRWGGFPGWENESSHPPELARLREGLISF